MLNKFVILLFLLFSQQSTFGDEPIIVTRATPSVATAGTEFTVELTIIKGDLSGFAQVLEELPAGFSASAIETENANFSFNNQVVKFIWQTLPQGNELRLSYRVSIANETNGIKLIGGSFVYLENEERKEINISPNEIFIEYKSLENIDRTIDKLIELEKSIENKTSTEDELPSLTGSHQSGSQKSSEDSRNREIVLAQNEDENILSNLANIAFRIQVAAAYNKIPDAYFKSEFNIMEQIYSEIHDGMNKYLVGSFSDFSEAQKHLYDIKNKGIKGAFLVAYKDGNRISVSKAIIMSQY